MTENVLPAFVESKMMYCKEVWGSATAHHIRKVHLIQAAALRIALGCPKLSPTAAMEVEFSVEPIDLYIKIHILNVKVLLNLTVKVLLRNLLITTDIYTWR